MMNSTTMKKSFLKNFGFKFQIPTLYFLDIKTFERDLSYMFRISKKALPKEEKYKVYTHYMDGTNQLSTFGSIYENDLGILMIDLLYRGDAYPEV